MARSAMPPGLSAFLGAGAIVRTTVFISRGGDWDRLSLSPWSASASSPVGIWNSESRKYFRAAVWHLFSDLSSQPPLALRQVDTPVCLMTCGQVSPLAWATVKEYSTAMALSSSNIAPPVSLL